MAPLDRVQSLKLYTKPNIPKVIFLTVIQSASLCLIPVQMKYLKCNFTIRSSCEYTQMKHIKIVQCLVNTQNCLQLLYNYSMHAVDRCVCDTDK